MVREGFDSFQELVTFTVEDVETVVDRIGKRGRNAVIIGLGIQRKIQALVRWLQRKQREGVNIATLDGRLFTKRVMRDMLARHALAEEEAGLSTSDDVTAPKSFKAHKWVSWRQRFENYVDTLSSPL